MIDIETIMPRLLQKPLSKELVTKLELEIQKQTKYWLTQVEKVNDRPLTDFTIEDWVNDVVAGIQDVANEKPMFSRGGILNYLKNVPPEKKVVQVSELREQFTDEEIRLFSWEDPQGWSYSAPSSGQLSDMKWVEKNFDSMLRMSNGNIAFYFYREH
jgi:hypothetical protein